MRLGRVVVALAMLGACAGEPAPPAASEVPADPSAVPAPTTTTVPAGVPDGTDVPVLAVLDGDSLAVEVDGARVEVRLLGVNAPERDECHGDRSREALEGMAGDAVRLVEVEGGDGTDQFGRLLRDVWSGGVWLNAALVAEGAAMALHTGAASQAELLALDEEAWQTGLGMWSQYACSDEPPPFDVAIAAVVADPPGPDEEALDAEEVVVANGSARPVDVSGWILRDESTRNRFVFPEGTVLAGGEDVTVTSGCDGLGFCSDVPVWNNGGDTALLQAPEGTVVDRYRYTRD